MGTERWATGLRVLRGLGMGCGPGNQPDEELVESGLAVWLVLGKRRPPVAVLTRSSRPGMDTTHEPDGDQSGIRSTPLFRSDLNRSAPTELSGNIGTSGPPP